MIMNLLSFAGLTPEQLFSAIYITGIIAFMGLIFLFNVLLSRHHGFKTGEDLDFTLQGQGEPFFYYRFASITAGWSRYKNCLYITGYRDYLHVRLMKVFGGGVLLIPMSEADISYRTSIWGKMAYISVQGKRFGFGITLTEKIRQHYDKNSPKG